MSRQEYSNKLEEKLATGYRLDIRQIILKAFGYFRKEPVLFFGYSSFLIFLSLLTARFQPLGSIISIFLTPALIAGFYHAAEKIDKNQKVTFYDFFLGFNNWLNIFVGATLAGLFTLIGVFLLLVPGIYLATSYIFIYPFLVSAGFEYWDAMEASRKLVTKNFWNIFLLLLALLALNFAGLMLFGFGIFISIPLTYLSIHVAFKEIMDADVTTDFNEPKKFDFRNFR